MEKCKKVGKLGPLICKPNWNDKFGDWKNQKDNFLEIHCDSRFGSIRANTCVFSGAWFYEVRLLTSGLMQIGWATLQTPFTNSDGCGDSPDSFAYDGYRILKWNGSQQNYGEQWHSGISFTNFYFNRGYYWMLY